MVTYFVFSLRENIIFGSLQLTKKIMEKGTVKFFNEAKGFGFIKVEGSGKEIFVHVSGILDEIRENDTVVFEIEEGKKGLSAVQVKLA